MLRSALSHVVWTPWPWGSIAWVQSGTTLLAEFSLDHPQFWVRYIIQQALLPNAELYFGITVIVQLLAGISLAFGMLTVLGALLTLVLVVVEGVLAYYVSDLVFGYYLMLGVLALVFGLTRAGRRWGFDIFLAGLRTRPVLW